MKHRLPLLPLTLCITTLLIAVPTSALVIHVPGDAATIQQGIDLAVDGDTVLVADGTWSGPGNVDLDFGGRAITVRSLGGPEACVIDCFSLIADRRGFWFHNGEGSDSVLRGFTIDMGRGASGGGIRCNGASPAIVDCVIRNCSADSYGGGIYGGNSSPRVIDCTIENCTANTGGGAYFTGGAPLFDGCRLTGNMATGDTLPALGGCLYASSSSPALVHTLLEGNSADLFGGGCAAWGSTTNLGNCLITGNSAGIGGGAIYVSLTNCDTISLTTAGNDASSGPVMYVFDSTVTISDSILLGSAPPAPGGPDPLIVTEAGAEPTVVHSCLAHDYPGVGNISADPHFCDGPAGPWYLGRTAAGQPADSPCLDAGSTAAELICFTGAAGESCLAGLTTCSDQRADDGTADMGWHPGPQSIAASIDAEPSSGTLPFSVRMRVSIQNLTAGPRTASGEIGLTLANGGTVEGWRSGEVLLSAGETVETAWQLNIPALPSLAGTNILDLLIADATPSPHGDPPYPAAGQAVEAACVFEGTWP